MFEYLQPADRPVIDGLEKYEVVLAKDQPEYNPLRVLPSLQHTGERMSRWTLTDKQREAVANGADIFIEILTFNGPMQPIRMAVSDNPNPDFFEIGYELNKIEPAEHSRG
jgi:hypothetical protein